MHRKLAAAAALALLAVAAPAGADPVPTAPCDVEDGRDVLGLAGTEESFAPSPVMAVGHDFDDIAGQSVLGYGDASVVAFDYRVDVSGSEDAPSATQANVTLALGWDNDTDFDLYVYDGDGNLLWDDNGFNPLDGAGETALLSAVAHCTDLHVEVVNYAGLPTSAMTLEGSLGRVR